MGFLSFMPSIRLFEPPPVQNTPASPDDLPATSPVETSDSRTTADHRPSSVSNSVPQSPGGPASSASVLQPSYSASTSGGTSQYGLSVAGSSASGSYTLEAPTSPSSHTSANRPTNFLLVPGGDLAESSASTTSSLRTIIHPQHPQSSPISPGLTKSSDPQVDSTPKYINRPVRSSMILDDDDETDFTKPPPQAAQSSPIVKYSLGLDTPAIPATSATNSTTNAPVLPSTRPVSAISTASASQPASNKATYSSATLSSNSSSNNSSSRGFFSKLRRNMSSSSRNNPLKSSEDLEEKEVQFRVRDEGCNSRVFGFVPSFPTPPKYIWVHAHKKKNREFTRMFLAQELVTEDSPRPSSEESFSQTTSGSSSGRFGHRRSSSTGSGTSSLSSTPSKQAASDPKRRAIWCAKFSLDGKYLATAGNDGIIRVWKVLSDIADREAFENSVNDLMSDDETDHLTVPQSPLLTPSSGPASQSKPYRRGSMRISNHKSKKSIVSAPVFSPKPYIEYTGHTQGVLDLCWSKNNFLLSASKDKTVRLWHVQLPNSIKTFVHNDFVTSIAFHPSDDRFFLSGSLDSKIRLWSIPENKVEFIREAPDYIMAVAFAPRGNTVVAGCFGGQCLVYDTEGLRRRLRILVRSTHGKNSNGSRITGIQIKTIPKRYDPGAALGQVDDATYLSETKMLVSTGDSRIRMYNLHTGQLEAKFKGHTTFDGQIHAFFSDTGDYIISGSEDQKTYIWRTRGGHPGAKSSRDEESSKTKESYEYFHSNKATVTVALFAPSASRALLYNSRDPIYDLAIPPPVILTPSSSSSAIEDGSFEHLPQEPLPLDPATLQKISSPIDGNIIITCDELGIIKVFRQDSAYERRKQASETASLIQKKRIGGLSLSPTQSRRTMASFDSNPQPTYYSEAAVARHATLPAVIASSSRSNSPSSLHAARFSDLSSQDSGNGGSNFVRPQYGSNSSLSAMNRSQSLNRHSPVRHEILLPPSTTQPISSLHRTASIRGRSSSSGPAPSTTSSQGGMSRSMSFSPGHGPNIAPTRQPLRPENGMSTVPQYQYAPSQLPPHTIQHTTRAESPSSISSLESFSPRHFIAQALANSGLSGYSNSVASSNASSNESQYIAYGVPASQSGAANQQLQQQRLSGSRDMSPVRQPVADTQTGQATDFLQCPNCASQDFKVRPTPRGPAMVCTQCGSVLNS